MRRVVVGMRHATVLYDGFDGRHSEADGLPVMLLPTRPPFRMGDQNVIHQM